MFDPGELLESRQSKLFLKMKICQNSKKLVGSFWFISALTLVF